MAKQVRGKIVENQGWDFSRFVPTFMSGQKKAAKVEKQEQKNQAVMSEVLTADLESEDIVTQFRAQLTAAWVLMLKEKGVVMTPAREKLISDFAKEWLVQLKLDNEDQFHAVMQKFEEDGNVFAIFAPQASRRSNRDEEVSPRARRRNNRDEDEPQARRRRNRDEDESPRGNRRNRDEDRAPFSRSKAVKLLEKLDDASEAWEEVEEEVSESYAEAATMVEKAIKAFDDEREMRAYKLMEEARALHERANTIAREYEDEEDEDEEPIMPAPKRSNRKKSEDNKPAPKRSNRKKSEDDKPAPKRSNRKESEDDKPARKRRS